MPLSLSYSTFLNFTSHLSRQLAPHWALSVFRRDTLTAILSLPERLVWPQIPFVMTDLSPMDLTEHIMSNRLYVSVRRLCLKSRDTILETKWSVKLVEDTWSLGGIGPKYDRLLFLH